MGQKKPHPPMRWGSSYWDQIPLVVNIDAAILSALEGNATLDMADWFTCDPTHFRAGWAVMLAGEAGQKLEEQLGTSAAAALIYTKSGSHPVSNWYADHKTALEDIKARAEHQLAASQLISLEENTIRAPGGDGDRRDKGNPTRRGAWAG